MAQRPSRVFFGFALLVVVVDPVLVVEVDDVEEVGDDSVVLMSVAASFSAVVASVVPSRLFRWDCMAPPRLMPSSTMSVFSLTKSSPRLLDTFTAATNCPRFRNPSAAVIRSVPAGRRFSSLLARFVLLFSFS
jgi:hypothetical protein